MTDNVDISVCFEGFGGRMRRFLDELKIRMLGYLKNCAPSFLLGFAGVGVGKVRSLYLRLGLPLPKDIPSGNEGFARLRPKREEILEKVISLAPFHTSKDISKQLG